MFHLALGIAPSNSRNIVCTLGKTTEKIRLLFAAIMGFGMIGMFCYLINEIQTEND